MKKSSLKKLIETVFKELENNMAETWVFKGAEKNFTEPQKNTIAKAVGMGFQLVSAYPAGGEGNMVAVVAKRKSGTPVEIEIGPDGKANSPMIKELTGTGAVAGYQTPFAFSKKKTGSQRALDVSKKLGLTPTGIEKNRG